MTTNLNSIFDELVSSEHIETNVLETRENIIRYFAHHAIITEAIHKTSTLLQLYLWKRCYQELYEHVCKGKNVNINEIFTKTKNELKTMHRLEDCFPSNIYTWKDISKLTKNIQPGTELLLPNRIIVKIRWLDKHYDDYVEKVCGILDKYCGSKTLNMDQLIEIKSVFEESYKLSGDIALKLYPSDICF